MYRSTFRKIARRIHEAARSITRLVAATSDALRAVMEIKRAESLVKGKRKHMLLIAWF